jgi:hypothetical protein
MSMVNCLVERLSALPVSMPARTSTTAALGEDSLRTDTKKLARSVCMHAVDGHLVSSPKFKGQEKGQGQKIN